MTRSFSMFRAQEPLKYKLRFPLIGHLLPFKIQLQISVFTYLWTYAFSKAKKKAIHFAAEFI